VTIVPTVLDFRRCGVAWRQPEIKRRLRQPEACKEHEASNSAGDRPPLAFRHPIGNDGAYRASRESDGRVMTDRLHQLATGDSLLDIPFRVWKNHPAAGVDFPDISIATSEAALTRPIVDALTSRLPGNIEVLAGIDIGGLGLAGALAYRSGLGFIDIRKVDSLRNGVMRSIMANYELGEGVVISRGARLAGRHVAIVDDCLISGGTALAAARLIRRLGGHCDTALFVFGIEGMGGRERLAHGGITAEVMRTIPPTAPEQTERG
jgi:adenine phosphoribosyltransferase